MCEHPTILEQLLAEPDLAHVDVRDGVRSLQPSRTRRREDGRSRLLVTAREADGPVRRLESTPPCEGCLDGLPLLDGAGEALEHDALMRWIQGARAGDASLRLPPGAATALEPVEAARSQLDPEAFAETDLAPVELGGRWGYARDDGALLIPARFDDAHPFREGFAAVREGTRWHLIDRFGVALGEQDFHTVRPFSCGLAAVMLRGRWGFIDRQGEIAIPMNYDAVTDFTDRLSAQATAGGRRITLKHPEAPEAKEGALMRVDPEREAAIARETAVASGAGLVVAMSVSLGTVFTVLGGIIALTGSYALLPVGVALLALGLGLHRWTSRGA